MRPTTLPSSSFEKKRRRAAAASATGRHLVVVCLVVGGFALCLCTTVYLFVSMHRLGRANADHVVDFTRNNIVTTTARRPPLPRLPDPDPADATAVAAAADAVDDDTVGTCYSHGTVVAGTGVRRVPSTNDGYCDCPTTGGDELRTAACSLALVAQPVFDCGDRDGVVLYASRVGDGVCDCANGRDEDMTGACQTKPVSRGYLRGWG